MNVVEYIDDRGYKQKALTPEAGDPRQGIPLSVPDLDRLDWDEIKRRLHGLLLDKNMLSLDDVQQRQADFQWCILTAVKKPLLGLYQED